MALYKTLCAVAVTIFLASNGCLSAEFECGQGGQDLQPLDMPWVVFIEDGSFRCFGTLISSRQVLTSCSCNGSLDQVVLFIGGLNSVSETVFEASFGVFDGNDEDAEVNMEDSACVYTLPRPSTKTPICMREEGSNNITGATAAFAVCRARIADPSNCGITSESDQRCVENSESFTCGTLNGTGAVYFDEEQRKWFLAGITQRSDFLNQGDSTIISTVSFLDNGNMTIDCSDMTSTPMLQTSNVPITTGTSDFTTGTSDFTTGTPDFTTGTPDVTTMPQLPTKCPKPHPPKTTKPPCGCGDGEEDFKDDSVFGSGVVIHSSPFILFCVLVVSLYST